MAEMPKPCLPKTIASASLVAFIIDQKYTYGLPLYRLEQQFRRFDVDLSRQTLSNWLIAAATKWCKPLYDRMHTLLLNRSVIHADETPLQVLREKDRPAQAQSGAFPSRPIRVLVGFAAGGGADAIARTVAQRLSEQLGQSVIVDNRPGATSPIAASDTHRVTRGHITSTAGAAIAASRTAFPPIGVGTTQTSRHRAALAMQAQRTVA